MILDSEEQRTMLLQIINAITMTGKDIDAIYDLKQSILNARIKIILK